MPDTASQIIDQVLDANETRTPISIKGMGSKSFYGRSAEGRALNVSAHSGIVSYQASELVLTARAGTPLSEIDAALAEHGQVLSFEPPHFHGGGSLGGTLACNQSGPSRPWAGSVRDMVLGLRLINGRGEHLRFGGQVMKNVAGFDVARMQAGAMGCLGVITEISLKVMPQLDHSETVVCDIESANDAITMMNNFRSRPAPITGACWYFGRIYLRFGGAFSAVDAAVADFAGQYSGAAKLEDANRFWCDLRDQKLNFFAGDSPLWRLSVKASLPASHTDDECLIDWGGAQRWLRSNKDRAQLLEAIPDSTGQLSLFRHGDRAGDVFHPPSSNSQTLHQRLKTSFDPNGILNPGRLYSWL